MTDIKRFEPLWGIWRTEDEPIGEGSFGVVYRAVRNEFGKKYYSAVKHISIPANKSQILEARAEGNRDDEALAEYFRSIAMNLVKEIDLMNEVKGHTNIVSYEDHMVVPKESGIGYDIIIRMELLNGLNEVLCRSQLTDLDVIRLGIDICSALEVCVEKGIVHRDIKPSNIFVNDRGDYKLGDFGVARQLENTTAGMSKKGTFLYMAPEVYRGEPANFSADTFSLGLVMYRLLNGNRAPFLPVVSAKIKPGDNEAALARRMAGEPLPAPAFADGELTEVILKATQFDKSKRFANPTEFKAALMSLHGGIALGRNIPIIAAPASGSASEKIRSSGLERNLAAEMSRLESSGDATMLEFSESTGTVNPRVIIESAPAEEAKASPRRLGARGWGIIGGCAALAAAVAVGAVLFSGNGNADVQSTPGTEYSVEEPYEETDTENEAVEEKEEDAGQAVSVIELYGKEYSPDIRTLNLSGAEVESTEELLEKVGGFTELETIDMTGCRLSNDELLETQNRLGEVDLIWNVSICGIEVPSNTRYLHIHFEDGMPSGSSIIFSNNPDYYEYPFGLEGSGTPTVSTENTDSVRYLSRLEGLRVTMASGASFDASCLSEMKNLTSITIEGKGVKNPEALGSLTQLKEISIGCPVSDNYSFLRGLNSLQKLSVSNAESDLDPALLDGKEDLTDLDIEVYSKKAYTELLGILEKAPKIAKLDLYISVDDSIDFSLIGNTAVKELSLTVTRIPSQSMQTLFELDELSALSVYTYSRIMNEDTAEELKQALPECEISYYSWG